MFVQIGAVPSMIAWLGFAAGIITAIGNLVNFASGYGTLDAIGMVSMMVLQVVFGRWPLFFSR
jgi:hypothetical protein